MLLAPLLAALPGCSAPDGTILEDAPAPPDDTAPEDSASDGDDVPTVLVNELMPANEGAVLDDAGAASDWIELYNGGAVTVDLSGWSMSDDWTDPTRHVLPAGLAVGAGEHLVLWADGDADAGDAHVGFGLAEGGEAVGLFTPAGDVADWVVYDGVAADTAWARIPDGGDEWRELPRGTPGAANQALDRLDVVALAAGSTWRYLDTGADPGQGWQDPGFDDSTWASGAAPLGYGDTHTTTVSYGDDADDKPPTTWFRTAFTLDDGVAASAAEVTLSLVVDDGAVVWLNGQELTRLRMLSGEVAATDYARETASGTDETAWNALDVEPDALVDGENVLAVEVHQASASSSDLNFDLAFAITAYVAAR